MISFSEFSDRLLVGVTNKFLNFGRDFFFLLLLAAQLRPTATTFKIQYEEGYYHLLKHSYDDYCQTHA